MLHRLSLFAPILVLAASGCSGGAAAAAKSSPAPLPIVEAIVARHGTIAPALALSGVIAPYRQVGISANLSEPIADVFVQEGDHVHAGQVLARLQIDDLQAQLASAQRVVAEDVARYSQTAYQVSAVNAQDASAISSARAALAQAQVTLRGAQTDLARYQSLANQGYLATQTSDAQRTTVASDEAAVISARAALSQAIANSGANGRGSTAGEQQQELAASRAAADAAQATVDQLRRQIARAVIVSPVDGVVDSANANPGEYPTGRQLFTVEQSQRVYAILPTATSQVVQVRNGAAATVAAQGTSARYHGSVVAILDQVQPGTTNFTVKVLLDNPAGSCAPECRSRRPLPSRG